MKKIILALGIFFSGILFAQAQQAAPGQDEQTKNMVGKLTEVCQLSPDQVTKVTPFVKQFVATRIANKQKYASDANELKEANKVNRQSLNTQLKTILSADQQERLKEYQKDQNAQKGSGGE